MALISSGQLKFSEIQTEFGGENPIAFSEYYGGGTILGLSAGNSGRVITNIPLTGKIKMSNFHGSAKGTASSSSADVTISITAAGSTTTTHGYRNDGTTLGSIASGSATAYDGATIKALRAVMNVDLKLNTVLSRGFVVVLSGTRAQDFFTSIDVGSQNLTSSFGAGGGTHTQSGGNTTWSWTPYIPYNTGLAAWVSSSNDKDVDFNE